MDYIKLKRYIDLITSLIILVLFFWFFLFLCVLIKLDSPGPIFFKQKRVGINKTYFYIYKFRTMRIDTPKDVPTHLLKNPSQYITKAGRFLRRTSLDELPQIINIIRGDMSLIGPRPALWNQYDLIEQRDLYNANAVRPGLTGWAQINGRDEIPIELKARLDGDYIKRMNLFTDLKIFFYTVKKVVKSENISM